MRLGYLKKNVKDLYEKFSAGELNRFLRVKNNKNTVIRHQPERSPEAELAEDLPLTLNRDNGPYTMA